MAQWQKRHRHSRSAWWAGREQRKRTRPGGRLLSGKWQLGLHGEIPAQARLLLQVRVQALSVWVCKGRRSCGPIGLGSWCFLATPIERVLLSQVRIPSTNSQESITARPLLIRTAAPLLDPVWPLSLRDRFRRTVPRRPIRRPRSQQPTWERMRGSAPVA